MSNGTTFSVQKQLFLTTLLMLFFIISCSEERKVEEGHGAGKVIRSERPVREQNDPQVAKLNLNPDVARFIKKIDSSFDRTPYYVKINDRFLFYVCKGKWKQSDTGKFNNGNFLLGLVDENMDTLLPPVYTKIYNPDATVPGYIEIELKGKRGLFNYINGRIISPQYDIILPSHKPEWIAYGKSGNDHYAISPLGEVHLTGEIPSYTQLGENWNFDIHSDNIKYLYDSYNEYIEGDPIMGGGVVFTPSYFYHLGFLPEVIAGIGEEDKVDFALIKAKGNVTKTVTVSDKIYALFTSFYEEGIDARGWQIDQKNLITVDSKNNVVQQELLLSTQDWNLRQMCGKSSGFNYLKENIVEVYEVMSTDKIYPSFDYMTCYSYYKIHENGKIEKLESSRFFDFTKFIVLNENHFKGCFTKFRNESEIDEEGNVWVYDHLTMEDLDFMRNEIFAEYGLIFKSEKWQQYFSKQSWYKPQYDNVDHLLSGPDKANIKLILSIKEKMTGKEKEFTNKRLIKYAPAG